MGGGSVKKQNPLNCHSPGVWSGNLLRNKPFADGVALGKLPFLVVIATSLEAGVLRQRRLHRSQVFGLPEAPLPAVLRFFVFAPSMRKKTVPGRSLSGHAPPAAEQPSGAVAAASSVQGGSLEGRLARAPGCKEVVFPDGFVFSSGFPCQIFDSSTPRRNQNEFETWVDSPLEPSA